MAIKNMTEAGSVINLDGSEDVEFDKAGNHETELMLGDHKDRRVSDAGILPTPMAQATFFSKYFSFWWLNDLLSLGAKRPLQAEDLYGLLDREKTDALTDSLEREWEKEEYNSQQNGTRPSFLRTIIRAFGFGYSLLGIVALLHDLLKLAQPILLGQLVLYFVEDSRISTRDAYLYALGLSLFAFVSSIVNAPYSFMRQVYGMRIRVACTGLVYRKALKLSISALHGTTTGNIVNLVSSDAQKFDWSTPFLHYLVVGPIVSAIVLALLWIEIGPPALAGMGLIVLLAPLQLKMGNMLFGFRTKAIRWMDERVKVMNEIIAGMRVIKMYTWEDSFSKWIRQIRRLDK